MSSYKSIFLVFRSILIVHFLKFNRPRCLFFNRRPASSPTLGFSGLVPPKLLSSILFRSICGVLVQKYFFISQSILLFHFLKFSQQRCLFLIRRPASPPLAWVALSPKASVQQHGSLLSHNDWSAHTGDIFPPPKYPLPQMPTSNSRLKNTSQIPPLHLSLKDVFLVSAK